MCMNRMRAEERGAQWSGVGKMRDSWYMMRDTPVCAVHTRVAEGLSLTRCAFYDAICS